MTPLQRDSAALRPDETSVLLPVHGGLHTLVDRDIAEKLQGTSLSIRAPGCGRGPGYVQLGRSGPRRQLHTFVAGHRESLVIDHRSGNRLDNRRRNLRHVTQTVNQLNHSRRLRYGWRGVRREGRAWRARPAARRFGTTHTVAVLAAIERDEFIWRRHHVRDVLNFPHFVKRPDLPGFLQATGGRIFRVWFVKRATGSLRVMTCRTVDPKLALPTGTADEPGLFDGLRFDPAERNLAAVFDMRQRGYRFVPVEGVLAVASRGQRYRIIDTRPAGPGNPKSEARNPKQARSSNDRYAGRHAYARGSMPCETDEAWLRQHSHGAPLTCACSGRAS